MLLILACSLLPACTTSPTGRSQLMLISPESAIVESKKAYLSTVGELDKEDKLVDDPTMADRVATITGRLVTVAIEKIPHSANWEWSVAIVDDPETVNAWCMAGGRMAVYTGLFEKLHLTDDEFAQIMGHEISHALANHTAERMSRAMATSVGVVAVGVLAEHKVAAMGGAAVAAKTGPGTAQQPHRGVRGGPTWAWRLAALRRLRSGRRSHPVAEDGRARPAVPEPPEFLSTHPAPSQPRGRPRMAMIPTAMRDLNPPGRLAKRYTR